jgi:hypothetical protein
MDVTLYVYFSHQSYNAHVLYLFVGHTQSSTIVATAGSTLSKYLVTILNVRTQHHKLEYLVYIFFTKMTILRRVYTTCINYLASTVNTDYALFEVYTLW